MDRIDDFYPISTTFMNGGFGSVIGFRFKILGHTSSRNVSKLANRIGQLRRMVPHFNQLPDALQEAVKEGIIVLREEGRVVDLKSEDPRYWVSSADGGPRW